MADKQEVHPVIELMLKRMDSHPEEFLAPSGGRWYPVIAEINEWGNDEDRAIIAAKQREIRLEQAHKDALDELLNGEARRAQEQELKASQIRAQAQMAQQIIKQQYGTQGMGTLGTAAASPYANAMTTGIANELRLGSETISEGLLKQIKGKLGL